jgi:hypothetical protein
VTDLSKYNSTSGRFEAVYTIEVQTLAEDVDRILDAVMKVHPLAYGNYERNASVTGVGYETAQPKAGSTTTTHVDGFTAGSTETYPVVELKLSIERDLDVLEKVMSAILEVHHYEEPVIFVREAFASRAAYDPQSDNPHRWWNNGRGLLKIRGLEP